MTSEITNALFGYFETLYDLNRNLITLCGVDVIDNSGQYERYIADIIQAIPRLVPYVYDIQLTTVTGTVDTFLSGGLYLTEEVD